MTHVFDSNKHIKVYHFFWYFTMTPTKYNHFLFNYLCIFFRVFNSEKTRLNSVCKSFMIKSPQGIISMLAGTWKFLVEPSSIFWGYVISRGISILGEVRNMWISRATQQLLCSKSHDFLAFLALAHSKINQIA